MRVNLIILQIKQHCLVKTVAVCVCKKCECLFTIYVEEEQNFCTVCKSERIDVIWISSVIKKEWK